MAPKRNTAAAAAAQQSHPDPDAMIAELFRQASGLAATTGAQVAVVAVRPDGEVLQYGCPNVGSVVDRFVGQASAGPAAPARDDHGATVDRIVRAYVARKRAEDPSYGEGTARDRELKDLRLELEVLERLRARLAA